MHLFITIYSSFSVEVFLRLVHSYGRLWAIFPTKIPAQQKLLKQKRARGAVEKGEPWEKKNRASAFVLSRSCFKLKKILHNLFSIKKNLAQPERVKTIHAPENCSTTPPPPQKNNGASLNYRPPIQVQSQPCQVPVRCLWRSDDAPSQGTVDTLQMVQRWWITHQTLRQLQFQR